MRIDLIIEGTEYVAEPYLGQTECIDCALAKLCDDIYTQPCKMYQSKVIFKENKKLDLNKPPEIPSPGDTIRITHKIMGGSQLKAGDLVKVISACENFDRIYVRVKKEGCSIPKRITSDRMRWEIVR